MCGGTARDESQSLGVILRRQCGELMIRESEDLLKCVVIYLLSRYGEIDVLLCRKSAAAVFYDCRSFLFCKVELLRCFLHSTIAFKVYIT